MRHLQEVLRVLDHALHLEGRAMAFTPETKLLGSLPEFDSMGILAVITGLENQFGITLEDDQLSGESFSTVGRLCELVNQQLD